MSAHWWSLVPLVFLDRLIGDDRFLHAQVAIKTRILPMLGAGRRGSIALRLYG